MGAELEWFKKRKTKVLSPFLNSYNLVAFTKYLLWLIGNLKIHFKKSFNKTQRIGVKIIKSAGKTFPRDLN